jgi:hypothetical protein
MVWISGMVIFSVRDWASDESSTSRFQPIYVSLSLIQICFYKTKVSLKVIEYEMTWYETTLHARWNTK